MSQLCRKALRNGMFINRRDSITCALLSLPQHATFFRKPNPKSNFRCYHLRRAKHVTEKQFTNHSTFGECLEPLSSHAHYWFSEFLPLHAPSNVEIGRCGAWGTSFMTGVDYSAFQANHHNKKRFYDSNSA